jgi:hypothetical protein
MQNRGEHNCEHAHEQAKNSGQHRFRTPDDGYPAKASDKSDPITNRGVAACRTSHGLQETLGHQTGSTMCRFLLKNKTRHRLLPAGPRRVGLVSRWLAFGHDLPVVSLAAIVPNVRI